MLLDFRVILRRTLRRPLTLLALIVLVALAVGVNTAVFSQVNDVLLADLPYPEASRLVRIWTSTRDSSPEAVWEGDYQALARAQGRQLASLAAFRPAEMTLERRAGLDQVRGVFVTRTFFKVLQVWPRCSSEMSLDVLLARGSGVVFIRESYARRLFADAACGASESLIIDRRRYEVAGFVPDAIAIPDRETALYVVYGVLR